MSDASLRRPLQRVLWFKDGRLLDTGPRKYREYGMKKQLRITSLSPEDMGLYECALPGIAGQRGRAELWSEWH